MELSGSGGGKSASNYNDRWRSAWIRLSDRKMRVFPAREGRSIARTGHAVDDEHHSFSVEYDMPGKHGFDRLYRYRLDPFDSNGQPVEAGEGG